MKFPSALNATSIRLSALYLCIFLLSFAVVGTVIFLLVNHSLERQLKRNIDTEVFELQADYQRGGIEELKEEILEKEAISNSRAFRYALFNSKLNSIAGSLPSNLFSAEEGWKVAALQSPRHKDKNIFYIRTLHVKGDLWLSVADDGEYIEDAGEGIVRAFLLGIVIAVILGVSGGYYLTRLFLKKIDRITTLTKSIIAGDLKSRLEISGNKDELDVLAVLLNRMLDKISTSIENIQQISNDIAHDLRTPISRLKYKLEDISRKEMPVAQYQDGLRGAIAEVDIILEIFSAMLRIAQIESGSRRKGFRQIDLTNILMNVIEALMPIAEEKGTVIIFYPMDAILISGDKELLTQMFFNLLENAIIHSGQNAKINIQLARMQNEVSITIADNGPGIPVESREKVFQRFSRLDQSRTTPGNGLGLSIVAAITELHNGKIALLDGQPGLKVCIYLARSA